MSLQEVQEAFERWLGVRIDIGFLSRIPTWLYITVPAVFLTYKYLTRQFGTFKKLGIKGPKPYPVVGTTGPLFKLGISEHDQQMRQYGSVVGLFELGRPALMVYDLDMLKQIFVKEFSSFTNRVSVGVDEYPIRKLLTNVNDDEWRHIRNTLTPTFSTGKLRKMNSHIRRAAKSLLANLLEKVDNNETFDFREFCGAFTMDAIASAAFGIEVDSHKDPNNCFVTMSKKLFKSSFSSPKVILMFLFPFLIKPLSKIGITIFPKDVSQFFIDVIRKSLEDRQKDGGKKETDFLQLMVNAHLEDAMEEDGEEKSWQTASGSTAKRKGLTEEEILAQGILFFLAGFETTANTLSLLGYSLATNPECQEKLLKEIDDALKDNDELDYDTVQRLPYLDMCVNETMRLYPAGVRTNRVTANDVTINGVFIPKDMMVVVPICAIHMDPEVWPEPTKFIPERFTPEQKEGRNPYSFIPFGAGPRNCIGMRLALAELKIATVVILQNLKFVPAPETEIPLKLDKISMKGVNGTKIRAERRNKH